MSTFNTRTDTSDALIKIMTDHFWSKVKNEIVHYEYGYETHIDSSVQSSLRLRQSTTAKHVRFAPDFLVYNINKTDGDILLEYKVTKTPRYTLNDTQWFYGQIEADALENYLNLINAGVNVAVVIYCPYSPNPLLCDIPSPNWITGTRQRTYSSSGSGTDFYNIDLRKLRTFEEFISQAMDINIISVRTLLTSAFYSSLRTTPILKTTHAYKSMYSRPEYSTGFNWLLKYK